jgi:hypothetical protein
MPGFVSYIPIATTVIALFFAPVVFLRWRSRKPAPHLFWWALGIAMFGVGTLTESLTTLFGWNEVVFRSWYISGALLGGAPLAQGTVYLMFKRKTANRMTVVLVLAILAASTAVLLSPINYDAVEAFSPFINIYAAIFLIGGAVLSAWRFRSDSTARHRFTGNCYIAMGALLPGIGGTATRFGHTEVLYVMEFLGLILIWIGYRYNVGPGLRGAPVPDIESGGLEREPAAV